MRPVFGQPMPEPVVTERCKRLYFADMANKLFRPSNGSEGEWFTSQFCERCVKDKPETEEYCIILTLSLCYDVYNPRYPRQWHYDEKGYPYCEEFEKRKEV